MSQRKAALNNPHESMFLIPNLVVVVLKKALPDPSSLPLALSLWLKFASHHSLSPGDAGPVQGGSRAQIFDPGWKTEHQHGESCSGPLGSGLRQQAEAVVKDQCWTN